MGCASVVAFMHALTLACCCGFIACKVNKLFRNKIAVLLCWSFFFFDPLLIWYSVTVWKDIVFSGVFFCFAFLLVEIVLRPDNFALKRSNIVLLVLFAVLSSLLRSNGFIAVGVALFVACFIVSKQIRRTMRCVTICVVVLFAVVTIPVYRIAGVAPAHFAETVGVPLQQISRVVHDNGKLSEENEEYIKSVLPLEEWGELYNPGCPNPLKFSPDFNDDILEGDKLRFISNWVSIGIKNPGIYLRAWIAQTHDYWSLNSTTWYTSAAGYDIGEGLKSNSYLNEFVSQSDLGKYLSLTVSAFPFVFSIGFLAWSMLGGSLIAFLSGRGKSLMFFLPFVVLWMTFLLAAPSNDFRYMLSLHMAFPLFVLFAFWDFSQEKDISKTEKI